MAVTRFQKRVYEALKLVPVGRVTTYKFLAAAIGCHSARAIGQALRVNPFAPHVPCHRVIRSDLTIGGFHGEVTGSEIARKKRLLAQEGVLFKDGRLRDRARVFQCETLTGS